MNIEIDSRENTRINTARKLYTQHDIEVKQLETGDFIFNKEVAFEYKKMEDFVNSVQNNRVFEQALRLNKQFKYPFVIIEASDEDLQLFYNTLQFKRKTKKKDKKPQKFYEKHFYGAIASLNKIVTVIRCPTEYRCFKTMLVQAQKCLENKPMNRKIAKTGVPAYRCLRYCIDRVGPKTAEKIVKNTGAKTLEDVVALNIDDLVSIRGISRSKSEDIIKQIKGL